MHLSELQSKDIVNIEGKKIGNIVDVRISKEGYIEALIIGKNRFSFFKNNDEEEIKWNMIKKIGEDVILVDTKN